MAVREFNGTTDIIKTSGGSVGQLTNGAWTLVNIIRPTVLDVHRGTMGVGAGSALLIAMNVRNDDVLIAIDDTFDNGEPVGLAAGVWHICAITKPSGTATPRFHGKPLGSGVWAHTNAVTNWTPTAGTCDKCWLGGYGDNVFDPPFSGRVATSAVFTAELSDADVESIQTTPSTRQLADLGAVALWDLNQASTSDPVLDLVGTADQTSISGTTVVNGGDPPGWTFGLSAPVSVTPAMIQPVGHGTGMGYW